MANASRPSGVKDNIHEKCRDAAAKEAAEYAHKFLQGDQGDETTNTLNQGLRQLHDKTYPECIQSADPDPRR